MHSPFAAFAKLGVAALALLPATLLHAIDLTPRYAESSEDGALFRRLYFQEGNEKYTVSRSANTEVSGNGEAIFQFTDLRSATCVLKVSPHSPDQSFKGPAMQAYRSTARTFAPLGIERPGSKLEQASPFKINEWTSYRFQSAYSIPGNTIAQAVTFLNLSPKQQIIIVTTAFDGDFATADARAKGIIQSWRSIPAEHLADPGTN